LPARASQTGRTRSTTETVASPPAANFGCRPPVADARNKQAASHSPAHWSPSTVAGDPGRGQHLVPSCAASRFSAARSTLPALSGISARNSTSSGAL
jgi:hypothetical protein